LSEPIKLYVRLKGNIASQFSQIKRYLGLENDTEVVRALISRYYREHQEELPPMIEHFNTYEDHITLRDHRIGRYVDIFARDGKLWCEQCEGSKCEHIEYALSVPEIIRVLEKRGWI